MSSVVDPQRLPDTRPHGMISGLRVQVVWWLEWVDANGQRCRGPEHGFVQSHGMDADRPRFAAASMLIIQADLARAMVSRLYIEGRPVVGQELRAILDSAISASTSKAEMSRERVRRLDAALAGIRAEDADSSEPFWLDPVEDCAGAP